MSDCICQVRYKIARTDALHRTVCFCMNDYLRVHDWLFSTKWTVQLVDVSALLLLLGPWLSDIRLGL